MRKVFGKKGVLAKENEELGTGEDTGTEAAGAGAETLENDLIQIEAEGNEVETNDTEIEEGVEAAAALESMYHDVAIAAKNGGYDRHGARMMQIAHESIMALAAGVPARTFALESFGGAGSRVGATTLALEGIGESLKAIWAKIIAAIKAGIEKVKAFFLALFGSAEKLKKRAEALAERANGTTGSLKDAEAKSITNAGLYKRLHVSGTVTKAGTMGDTLENVTKSVMQSWDGMIKAGEGVVDVMEQIAEGKDDVAKTFSIPYVKIGALKPYSGAEHKTEAAGMGTFISDELPGGRAVVVIAPTADKFTNALEVSAFQGGVLAFDPKAKEPSKDKLDTLDIGVCTAVANKVVSIAEILIESRKNTSKADAVKKKGSVAADKIAKHIANENFDDKAKANATAPTNAAVDGTDASALKGSYESAKKLATKFSTILDQPVMSMMKESVLMGKGMLDYVELSLAKYGK